MVQVMEFVSNEMMMMFEHDFSWIEQPPQTNAT